MNKQAIIKDTIQTLNRLPEDKVHQVHDFAEYLLSKLDDSLITEGIRQLAASSNAFDYLNEEKDFYTVNDLKVKYKSWH